MKKTLILIGILIVVIVGIFFFNQSRKLTPVVVKEPVKGDVVLISKFLNTKYIRTSTEGWPPLVTALTRAFSCTPSGSVIEGTGRTIERTIHGKHYCVTTRNEGAAGSTYTTYTYRTNTTQTVFTLRFSQCENYDDPEKSVCKKEQSLFNPDMIIK